MKNELTFIKMSIAGIKDYDAFCKTMRIYHTFSNLQRFFKNDLLSD